MPFCFFCSCLTDKIENGDVYQRRRGTHSGVSNGQDTGSKQVEEIGRTGNSWRRILLLILAITIHNIPGLSELCLLSMKCTQLWLKGLLLNLICFSSCQCRFSITQVIVIQVRSLHATGLVKIFLEDVSLKASLVLNWLMVKLENIAFVDH